MVMEVLHEDIGEESMQCLNHPYKNSTPGGICAFCLQEKLGKLVSSSYPSSVFPSSSSYSSSPSASHASSATSGGGATLQPQQLSSSSADSQSNGHYSRKARLPFVLTHKKKKKIKDGVMVMNCSDSTTGIVFNRSKSTASPRRRGNNNNNNNNNGNYSEDSYYSPNKRGFWSFLHLSKHYSTPKKSDGQYKDTTNFITSTPSTITTTVGSSSLAKREDEFVAVDENVVSPNDNPASTFERRVSRSRSVGCGSRSFSGDIFDRISTGFGDCTLRRVESQREGSSNKHKVQPVLQRNSIGNNQDCIKERVKCGGIFSGFTIASVGESTVNHNIKSKSWVWAFASPMRAFGKPSNGKKDDNNNNNNSNKNGTPNLDAVPSLLAVSG